MRAIDLRCGPALAGWLLLTLLAQPASAIELSAPVACPAGMICPVQNLFDHDSGPAMRDFRCGALGYDGHDGVDVRLPSMAVQKAGVDVLAVADGTVMASRDGAPDTGLSAGREAVRSIECGNGVLIDHGGGYVTQSCHMARGSIAVRKGEAVARGQRLGRVGLSGMTEFPHLHLTLRKDGKPIDPFAPDGPSATCGSSTTGLWSAAAAAQMRVETPLVLNQGLSTGPVPNAAIESGEAGLRPVARFAPAIVAYARVIGLDAGDVVRVSLLGPDGKELARNEAPPMDRPKAQWIAFAGLKSPPAGWGPGDYVGRVEVLRGGAALKSSEVRATIGK